MNLLALEDAAGVDAHLAIRIAKAGPIAYEAAGCGELALHPAQRRAFLRITARSTGRVRADDPARAIAAALGGPRAPTRWPSSPTTASPAPTVVHLKRGGVWHELLPVPSSGTIGDTVIFTGEDYGNALDDDPVIDLGGELPDWKNKTWNLLGSDVWECTYNWGFGSDGPGRVWFNGDAITGDEYDGISGNSANSYSDGLGNRPAYGESGNDMPTADHPFYYTSSGKLRVYAPGGPTALYSTIEVSWLPGFYGMTWIDRSYVKFKYIEFRRGNALIELQNCDHFSFEHCKIGKGTARYILRAVPNDLGDPSDNGVISDCEFHRDDYCQHTFDYGGTADVAKAGGNDAILLQSASNWEIKGTAFTTCGHGGVDIDAGGGSIAEGNYIHDCRFSGGGDYDRAFLINSNGDFGAEGARNNRFIRKKPRPSCCPLPNRSGPMAGPCAQMRPERP